MHVQNQVWIVNNYSFSESTLKDAHEGQVECMAWLYNGSILLTGGKDSTIKVWDVEQKYFVVVSEHQFLLPRDDCCAQEQC